MDNPVTLCGCWELRSGPLQEQSRGFASDHLSSPFLPFLPFLFFRRHPRFHVARLASVPCVVKNDFELLTLRPLHTLPPPVLGLEADVSITMLDSSFPFCWGFPNL